MDEIKKDKIKSQSIKLNILELISIIAKELDPSKMKKDDDKIYFMQKKLNKMNFGTSGGSVFNNFFGINTPEASIQIFYFSGSNGSH